MDDTWKRARAVKPFSAVQNGRVLQDLKEAMLVRRLYKRGVLVRQGDEPRLVYLLLDGAVYSFTECNDKTAVCEVAPAPVLLPLEATLSGGASLHTWETLSPTVACSFPIDVFTAACERDAHFALAVAQQVARQHRNASRALLSERLRTTTERLANWLLQEHRKQHGGPITILTKKNVLAAQLGMAPENLSRSLLLLSNHGVRSEGQQQVYVYDEKALEKFARPNVLLDGS